MAWYRFDETSGSVAIELSLYQHLKLDGDLAPALTPASAPLHFTTAGYTLAPFFVADPSPDADSRATTPYHVYIRRREPAIVFRTVNSGVPNRAGDKGVTFLDALWDDAPFRTHRDFMTAVNRTAGVWQQAGRLSAQERTAVIAAATKAEHELA